MARLPYHRRGRGEERFAEGKSNGPVDRLERRRGPRPSERPRSPASSYFQRLEQLAIADALHYHRRRTGGRVVEGTALEMRRRCKPTVGSNPTLSATT